jgi:hypothetical protein
VVKTEVGNPDQPVTKPIAQPSVVSRRAFAVVVFHSVHPDKSTVDEHASEDSLKVEPMALYIILILINVEVKILV